jgi:hypothetical protein
MMHPSSVGKSRMDHVFTMKAVWPTQKKIKTVVFWGPDDGGSKHL